MNANSSRLALVFAQHLADFLHVGVFGAKFRFHFPERRSQRLHDALLAIRPPTCRAPTSSHHTYALCLRLALSRLLSISISRREEHSASMMFSSPFHSPSYRTSTSHQNTSAFSFSPSRAIVTPSSQFTRPPIVRQHEVTTHSLSLARARALSLSRSLSISRSDERRASTAPFSTFACPLVVHLHNVSWLSLSTPQ